MSDTQHNSVTDPQIPHVPRSRRRFTVGVVMAAIVGLATLSVLFGIGRGRGNDRAETPAFAPDMTKQPVTVVNTASIAAAPAVPPRHDNKNKRPVRVAAQTAEAEPAQAETAPEPSAPRSDAVASNKRTSPPRAVKKATRVVRRSAKQPARPVPVRRSATKAQRTLVASTAGAGGAPTGGMDWPQYRGPSRDGISAEKGWLGTWPANGPKVLWKTSVGTGFSSMAVTNGRVFTMGNQGEQDIVFCLDAGSGRVIWKHTYPSPKSPNSYEGGPNATPTVDGNAVYTFSKQGQLFCLDAESGKAIWSKTAADFNANPPGWGYSGSPLVVGNLVIAEYGARGATLVALDKATGDVVWKSGNDGPGYSSPVPFNWKGVPYVAGFNAFGLVVYNVADGKELYRFPWKTAHDVNAATPIVSGDKVFISSGYNTGCALLQITKDNPVLWKNRNMRNHFNASVLYDGHIYGFDEAELKCLDGATGEEVWSQRGLGKGSLMAADGKLIVLSERGELVIAQASPDRFQELSRAQILGGKCWTMPVLSGGRVYARNADGDLVCVDVTGRA